MQVSHRFCTEIPQTGNLQTNKSRCGADIGNAMQKERNRNHRSRMLPRSYPYAGKDTAEVFCKIVGYLKGKSSLMIFEKHANLKYKYGNRHFWCRGYYVDTVGKNTAAIKEYIQN